MYNTYIQRIVELFDFIMKDNNNLFYSIVFDLLIENGVFSADDEFNYKDEPKELSLKPGLSVISGEGVCRNLSSREKIFSP